MSWESSAIYYRLINEGVRQRSGGLHSAKSVLYSIDFAEMEELQRTGRWDRAGAMLVDAAARVQGAGADFLLLCTNTMHRVAEQVSSSVRIPLVHIADSTAAAIADQGLQRVGLIGTMYKMEQEFYRGRLEDRHGMEVLVPDRTERGVVHELIYSELVVGRIVQASRLAYQRVMARLVDHGAQGIILGCTEIGLLVSAKDAGVPIFDTTRIHAEHAVELAFANRMALGSSSI
jgi:aspartate racemase